MKKLPITCLAGILAVSAVSCGQNKEKEDNSYNDSIANVLVGYSVNSIKLAN